MKIILFIAFLFLGLKTIFGQDDFARVNDSLQTLLEQKISDSLKTGVLVRLHNHWKNKSYIKSLEYARQAIEYSEKHMSRASTLGIKFMLGYTYMEAGDAVRSLEILHPLAEELKNTDTFGYSTALAFIAMNYDKQGYYKKAIGYQVKSYTIFEHATITDSAAESRAFLGGPQMLAVYYLNDKQTDSALKYAQLAYRRLKQTKLTEWNRFFSWYIKKTLGDVYAELTDYNKAANYYTVAEREASLYNFLPDLLPIYMSLSKVYYKQKNILTAVKYAHKCYALADTLNILPSIKESASFLKMLYIGEGKMDSALLYSDIAAAAKDSLFNIDVARKTDAMEFAAQKKEQETKALQKENNLRKNLYYLICGIFISLLAALFLYHKNRLKQKANQLLEYEKKEISMQHRQMQQQAESFEMQALKAQMNPHFIFNCINSIDALIQSNDKYNATLYLNKFAKLLRNILDGSKQNTASFSKDIETLKLYVELEQLRNENKFKSSFEIDPELMSGDYIVPPLIVQPFVENAILHGLRARNGNGGRLTIDIKKAEDKIEYIITDNGIGRKAVERIKQDKDSHYGMQMGSNRVRLFNKEETPSVLIEDLYRDGSPSGTRVTVSLNIV